MRGEEKNKSIDPDVLYTMDALEKRYGSWQKGTKIWEASKYLVSISRGHEVAEEIRNGADPERYNPKELFRAQRIFVNTHDRTNYQKVQIVCKGRIERGEFDREGHWTHGELKVL